MDMYSISVVILQCHSICNTAYRCCQQSLYNNCQLNRANELLVRMSLGKARNQLTKVLRHEQKTLDYVYKARALVKPNIYSDALAFYKMAGRNTKVYACKIKLASNTNNTKTFATA